MQFCRLGFRVSAERCDRRKDWLKLAVHSSTYNARFFQPLARGRHWPQKSLPQCATKQTFWRRFESKARNTEQTSEVSLRGAPVTAAPRTPPEMSSFSFASRCSPSQSLSSSSVLFIVTSGGACIFREDINFKGIFLAARKTDCIFEMKSNGSEKQRAIVGIDLPSAIHGLEKVQFLKKFKNSFGHIRIPPWPINMADRGAYHDSGVPKHFSS